jgi:hypothetical protein
VDPTLAQTSDVTKIFLGQGVLGALVLVLFFAIWKLWQKNNESQEKRVELAMKVTETVDVVTSSLERNTDAIERLERDRGEPKP